MKLLSLMGSPRKGRSTDTLLDAAGNAFAEAGGDVEKLHVPDLDIKPCVGCYGCMKDLDTVCVQRDDMDAVYGKLLEADALLWGTPIYMWSPTAQFKLFLDRLFPLGDYQSTRWRCKLAGKPVGLVIVYADPDPIHSGIAQTHAILDVVARASGGTVARVVHGAVGDEDVLDEDHALVKRAGALGTTLARAAGEWRAQRD